MPVFGELAAARKAATKVVDDTIYRNKFLAHCNSARLHLFDEQGLRLRVPAAPRRARAGARAGHEQARALRRGVAL